MKNNSFTKTISVFMAAAFAILLATIAVALSACGVADTKSTSSSSDKESVIQSDETEEGSAGSEVITADEMSNDEDGEHVIEADSETAAYSNIKITKTGDSDEGDEADFYGDNAAVFATNGADLTLSEMNISTNGKHANAVFSYGDGTTVTIKDSVIETSGDCSGGIMTTGGGTMNAENLTIHTTGNSSAAIRSDRGGGTVTVTEGTYTTEGTGSPAIYSTADITVNDATLTSTASQGIVVEGQNSVTLNNVTLNADNNTKNSDKSDYYQAVMIYQSMSGDADEGTAEFTMNGGSLTNENGDVFFVNNTVATISLSGAEIKNNDVDGVLLRAAAAGWGSEGTNGGNVNLYADAQTIEGNIVTDEISAVNFYLSNGSSYTGTINADNEGNVYVEIEKGSTWKLTGNSYISSLTCDESAIDLNGYTLYINGEEYKAGTSSTGSEVDFIIAESSHGDRPDAPPDGEQGEKPDGDQGGKPDGEQGMKSGENGGGTPPDKPDGDDRQAPPDKTDGEPPAKPE